VRVAISFAIISAHVFHPQLFSKGDRFQELLEAAALECHESVRLVVELMKSPHNTQNRDDLILARRKEKKISEQISNELVKTFITGLEREDIEALARGLFRIPRPPRSSPNASSWPAVIWTG